MFMTTNHIERLDPALIRPGRCDVKIEVRLASKNQMRTLFLRFFPDDTARADQFADSLPSDQISMATLQGHLLAYRYGRDSSAHPPALCSCGCNVLLLRFRLRSPVCSSLAYPTLRIHLPRLA